MQIIQRKQISLEQSIELLKKIMSINSVQICFEPAKNKFRVTDLSDAPLFDFRFPLSFTLPEKNVLEFLNRVNPVPENYIVLLIQAGHAAAGIFVEGKLQYHKVIRKYMVRKKQGKAQISYLKTKGKSRLGSRIRLAESRKFFAEINQLLVNWYSEKSINRIIYSCPVTLWGLLHRASPLPPFSKKDARLIRIPYDVKIPKMEELMHIDRLINQGQITVYSETVVLDELIPTE